MRYGILGLAAVFALSSCEAPGRRVTEEPVIRPSEVTDFRVLYRQNCSGCHGANGQGSLSVEIGSPAYLAIADDATIRRVTEDGTPGTAMPAFGQKAGGFLTEPQIDTLVRGIRNWANPGKLGSEKPPAYTAAQSGDPTRGQTVFTAACATCHGPDGRGARAIADTSYLALVSDQHLRTMVIIGMPQLGMPDWRNHSKPLSDSDVADVVAWLASQREPLSAHMHH